MAVTPVDVGGSIAKGLQINQMRQQMEAEKQAQQERNALKSLYAERFGGTDPNTGITWNTGRQGPGAMKNEQFVGRAMSISPEAGVNWQQYFAQQDEATRTRRTQEAPLVAAALEGVQDQAGWDRARAFLAQRNVDVSDMPPQYDPALANMTSQAARYLGNISTPKGPEPTQLAKLQNELAALAPGDPRRAAYEDAIRKATQFAPPAQTRIDVNTGPQGIDYGDPPKDYAWARGQDGRVLLSEPDANGYRSPIAVPIAGGPAAREITAAEEAKKAGQQSKATTANIVVEDINRIFDIMGSSTLPVAGFGAWAAAVPGTPQHDVARLLDGIKANVGFDKLQAMREASPTGGALGQVSENENRLLQSVLGNLEQSQSPEQFQPNLDRVREVFLDIVHGVGNRPAQAGGTATQGADFSAMSPQELLAVDVTKLSPEQLDAYAAALSAVGY